MYLSMYGMYSCLHSMYGVCSVGEGVESERKGNTH